jgi:hypothetical protein
MEILKLEKLKASKMKELVLKKRLVLEDVCRQAHMEPDPSTTSDKTNALIDSGTCIKLPKVSLSSQGSLKFFPVFKA